MPPNIPSPIIRGGGRGGRGITELLLTSLLRDFAGTGVTLSARGLFEDVLRPPSAAEQQLTAEQEFAQQQLRGMNQGGQLTDRRGRNPESQEIVQPRESEETNVLRQSPANPFSRNFDPEADPEQTAERLEDLQRTAPQRLQAEVARQSALVQQQSIADARRFLSEITDEGQQEQILGRFDFMTAASASGLDTSLINESLPPSQKDKIELAQAQLDLLSTESQQEADIFATGFLKRQGVLPANAPDTVPGSSDIMLSLREEAQKEKPNWIQEGTDYILGRIGETSAGTGGEFSVGGQVTAADFAGGESAVTVEEAIAEFSSFADRYIRAVDPAAADRVMKQLGSGAFERTLTRSAAEQQLVRVLQQNPDMPVEDIRETLKGGFTKDEINKIIRNAKRRANPATVR